MAWVTLSTLAKEPLATGRSRRRCDCQTAAFLFLVFSFFCCCVCVCRVVARCRFRSQRRRDVIETSAVGGRLGQWRATDDVVSAPRPENVASRHALASSLVFLSLFLSFFLSFFFFFFSFPDPLCRNDQSGRCCVEGSTTRVLPDCNFKKNNNKKQKPSASVITPDAINKTKTGGRATQFQRHINTKRSRRRRSR